MTCGPVENGAERFLPARSRADDLRFPRRLASFRSFNVMEFSRSEARLSPLGSDIEPVSRKISMIAGIFLPIFLVSINQQASGLRQTSSGPCSPNIANVAGKSTTQDRDALLLCRGCRRLGRLWAEHSSHDVVKCLGCQT